MMTYIASKPNKSQGAGNGGGWGFGPQTIEQSWQLHGPVESSTDSLQPLVALFIGFIPWTGTSTTNKQHIAEPVYYQVDFTPSQDKLPSVMNEPFTLKSSLHTVAFLSPAEE